MTSYFTASSISNGNQPLSDVIQSEINKYSTLKPTLVEAADGLITVALLDYCPVKSNAINKQGEPEFNTSLDRI